MGTSSFFADISAPISTNCYYVHVALFWMSGAVEVEPEAKQ